MGEGPLLGQEPSLIDLSGTGCSQRVDWERLVNVHTLANGATRKYFKGWKLKANLNWGMNALIPEALGSALNDIHNLTCSDPIFYFPYPEKYPGSFYKVIIGDLWNINFVRGLLGTGFQGSISLIGQDVLSSKPYFLT